LANKDLRLAPHRIKDDLRDVWWYEVPSGFRIFTVETTGVIEIKIPWKSIRAALKRKDKK